MKTMSDTPEQSKVGETFLDLQKPVEQLLRDVHDELLALRPIDDNVRHAYKRLASLLAVSAISADRYSRILVRLTWAIFMLTAVLVLLTVVLLYKA
jgi:hypothetical protein